jgi:hypothetical protein
VPRTWLGKAGEAQDVVVWQGGEVVAVLMDRGDGYEVVRVR